MHRVLIDALVTFQAAGALRGRGVVGGGGRGDGGVGAPERGGQGKREANLGEAHGVASARWPLVAFPAVYFTLMVAFAPARRDGSATIAEMPEVPAR